MQQSTVFPPWELDIIDPSISDFIFGFDGSIITNKNGQIGLSLNDFWNVLWPNAINSFETTMIVQLQPPIMNNLTVSVNGQFCGVDVII